MSDPNGAAKEPPFTLKDMETVLSIMDNQPLQNMQAARQLGSLQSRFRTFCTRALTPKAEAAAKGPKVKPTDPLA